MESDNLNSHSPLTIGARHSLGVISLTEDQIIEYAKMFDPLPFHTSVEDAKKSPFKRLIASGSHVFTLIHRDRWIPLFGNTVIAGLELNNWKFMKPVFADVVISSFVAIMNVKHNPEKKHSVVHWKYEFFDDKDELLQTLDMHVLHKNS